VLGEEEIAFIVSRWTGIPVTRLQEAETARLLRMEDELHTQVVAQEEAIKAIAKAIRRSRAGLKDPRRPIGSFIFSGPTGVGKTELARALAKFLFADASALIRVDMSEYMEKFSVSRLIGAPPGYVGYEDSGTLTKAVRRKPYSVILLDEIEKAHPGCVQHPAAGARRGAPDRQLRPRDRLQEHRRDHDVERRREGHHRRSTLGFGNTLDVTQNFDRIADKVKEEMQHAFNPEFLNRLDDVIVFHPLDKEHIAQIVSILLKDVQKRLGDEELTLRLTDAAVDFLVKHGYDVSYGARPLKRAIQRWIEDPLSEKILLAEFSRGDEITVDVAADGAKLEFRVPASSPKA
jgi:ATP-dependent Clp protease ATP-binding subunit ClpC